MDRLSAMLFCLKGLQLRPDGELHTDEQCWASGDPHLDEELCALDDSAGGI